MWCEPSVKIFGNDYPTCNGTCIRDNVHVSDLASTMSRRSIGWYNPFEYLGLIEVNPLDRWGRSPWV
jgi:hypothetical protein